MCSCCKGLKVLYFKKHEADTCPYRRACYCSFCAGNGHTTMECPYRVMNRPSFAAVEPNFPDVYESDFKPALEVVDNNANIRAFLLSYGISLSGKDKVNRENLVTLARNHDPPLELYWVNPTTGECVLHVDGPKKKAKN